MAALVGAALIGFLLGVLLMILVSAGHRDEDLAERVERSEAERRRADRTAEAAHSSAAGGDGQHADTGPVRGIRTDRKG